MANIRSWGIGLSAALIVLSGCSSDLVAPSGNRTAGDATTLLDKAQGLQRRLLDDGTEVVLDSAAGVLSDNKGHSHHLSRAAARGAGRAFARMAQIETFEAAVKGDKGYKKYMTWARAHANERGSHKYRSVVKRVPTSSIMLATPQAAPSVLPSVFGISAGRNVPPPSRMIEDGDPDPCYALAQNLWDDHVAYESAKTGYLSLVKGIVEGTIFTTHPEYDSEAGLVALDYAILDYGSNLDLAYVQYVATAAQYSLNRCLTDPNLLYDTNHHEVLDPGPPPTTVDLADGTTTSSGAGSGGGSVDTGVAGPPDETSTETTWLACSFTDYYDPSGGFMYEDFNGCFIYIAGT